MRVPVYSGETALLTKGEPLYRVYFYFTFTINRILRDGITLLVEMHALRDLVTLFD